MNLEKSLERWQSAGLITTQQSSDIIKFESEKPSASWVIFGLSGLGVMVVLTGIISIVAANWYDISPLIKITGYFLSLGILAYLTYRRDKIPGVVRESLLSAFGIYVLAGVALIGQTYNLESEGYSALFFWLAIILPVTLCTDSRLLNNIWFIGFAAAVTLWVMASDFNTYNGTPDFTRFFIAIALPYVFLAVGYALSGVTSEKFCAAARFWSYAVLLVPFAIAGNIAWTFSTARFTNEILGSLPIIPYAAAALALICVLLRKTQPGRFLTYAISLTIIATVILSLVPLNVHIGENKIVGCALFILAWSGAATIAAAIERRRIFDFAALVIGIRFVTVYFEVFGSLAATGIGLIISGGVILGTAYLWHHYRGQVARSIKGSV
jgi:uncharacterized membrane protein